MYPWAQTVILPPVYLRHSFTNCDFSISTLWDENGLGKTWPEPVSPELGTVERIWKLLHSESTKLCWWNQVYMWWKVWVWLAQSKQVILEKQELPQDPQMIGTRVHWVRNAPMITKIRSHPQSIFTFMLKQNGPYLIFQHLSRKDICKKYSYRNFN